MTQLAEIAPALLLLPALAPVVPIADGLPAEATAGLDSTPVVTTVATAPAQSTISDPYFGLLTNPPGDWGLIAWGEGHALVLKGGDEFRRRSLNLLYSFVGAPNGRDGQDPYEQSARFSKGIHIKEKDAAGNCMLPMNQERLAQGLSTWFYTQLYPARRVSEPVVDDEGDIIDWVVLNEGAIETEADALAASFIESIRGTALGCRFTGQGHDTPVDDYWIGSSGPSHSVGDGREGD